MKKADTVKLPKGVSQEFLDELSTMDTLQIKATIVRLQVQNEENEAFKETPEFQSAQADYDQAKELYDMTAGPVKETSVSLKNRTKAAVKRLQEKGGA